CAMLVSFLGRIPSPPCSALFPYTTLFRSIGNVVETVIAEPALNGLFQALQGTDNPAVGKRQRIGCHIDRTPQLGVGLAAGVHQQDRKSTRLNSSHAKTSYAVFCLKKENNS